MRATSMTVVAVLAVLAAPALAVFNAQCSAAYKTLDSYTRNSNFNDGNGGVEVCDQGAAGVINSGDAANNDWQGAGWYRFTGAAGTEMPTALVGDYSCGTDASGYLAGTHPVVADGIVTRQVCFGFFHRPCSWSADIQVVACNGFYLYNLVSAPALCLRYCGTNAPSGAAAVGSSDATVTPPTANSASPTSSSGFWPMPGIFVVLGVLAVAAIAVGVVFARRQSAAAATASAAAATAGPAAAEPEWDDALYATASSSTAAAAADAPVEVELDIDAHVSALTRSSDV